MDNFDDDYHDLNKLFSGIGLSRSPRQLIDEALSIAIPIMIKASVSPSNLEDLMLMSRALNRGNLGMLYHNVDDFINQIGEDIENLHFNTAVSQLMIYCNHLQSIYA